jgi:hypothetical protein
LLPGPNLEVEPGCEPRYDHLITEDHQPVDRILTEKIYRLLTRPLYASWPGPGGPSLVLANVGSFYQDKNPAAVPDCLLSLGVSCPADLHFKEGHSYYQWALGKPPDVLIEVVSDRKGGEEGFKKALYARQGIRYYAIFDPDHFLSPETLRCYALVVGTYEATDPGPWPGIGLGLRVWEGKADREKERAAREKDRASPAEALAAREKDRASQADARAGRAESRLRELEEQLRRSEGKAAP